MGAGRAMHHAPSSAATRAAIGLATAIALIAVLAGMPGAAHAQSDSHIADAEDAAAVARGRMVYAHACASCHGRNRQGQPLWQLIDEFAGRRAPAHDETGHTWQHGDEDLFRMTKYGRFAGTPADRVSHMPGFARRLSDDEILAVIAFIKARWPLGLRVSQALLNPGYAGMPPQADQVEWQLPPTCRTTLSQATTAPATGE